MVITVLPSRFGPSLFERLGRIAVLALVVIPPLAMWLGFADTVETPKRLVVSGLALVLAVTTAALPDRRARLLSAPFTGPLIGLAAVAAVAAWTSGIPAVGWAGEEGSWMGASTLVPVLLAAAFAGAWLSQAAVRRLAAGLAVAATLSVLYEAIQAAHLDPMPWNPALKGSYWLFAALGNPVHLANLLVAVFFASFAAWPAGPGWVWIPRLAWLAGAVATGERSALLGLAGGALAALLVHGFRSRRLLLLGLTVAVILAIPIAVGGGTGGRIFSGIRLTGARTRIWDGALRLVRQRPWLGAGPDLFYTRFPTVATYGFFTAEPPGLTGGSVQLRLPGSPHNEPLSWAGGMGVLGLGLYCWVLVTGLRAARRSPLLPAAASIWCVHLVNPPSVATTTVFWLLMAGAAARARPAPGAVRPGPAGRGRATVLVAVLALGASLFTTVRAGVAQAHRREAGWLAFAGRPTELAAHLTRWDGYAARVHPRQAADDAAAWRQLGNPDRAAALLAVARAANPENLFYDSALADLLLERGKRGHDRAALQDSERLLAADLVRAPAALSLYDDLAEVVAAGGRRREAARLRAERVRLDPLGLFKAGPPLLPESPPR